MHWVCPVNTNASNANHQQCSAELYQETMKRGKHNVAHDGQNQPALPKLKHQNYEAKLNGYLLDGHAAAVQKVAAQVLELSTGQVALNVLRPVRSCRDERQRD